MLTKHVKHWLATMGLLLCSLTTSAYDFEVNGICYNILSDVDLTVEVTESNNGYSGDVVIPSTVVYEGITYQVTSIGGYAFAYCSISSVTIPFGVTSIETRAFYSCSLTAIDLPEGVTSIGNSAFCGSGLASITIPNSVTSIEKFTFSVCPNLTTITISGSVKSIDYQAFYLSSLESITCKSVIPPTINHSGLSSVDSSIPIYVPALAIEAYKSAECWSEFTNIQAISSNDLASGTCGDNLTWKLTEEYELVIEGTGDMYNYEQGTAPWCEYCHMINKAILPDGVTSIGNHAFNDCSSLTSITIPESVTSIGEKAFSECSGLTTLTIPESVTSIEGWAFLYCNSLTSITIPANVINIGYGVLMGCNGLVSVIVDEGNPVYDSRYNCNAIIETSSNTLVGGCSITVIPDDITSIGNRAFCYCDFASIIIPESVTNIEDYAFGASSLTSITIPEGVTSIGREAFMNCENLTAITIPSSVKSISGNAFLSCNSLTAVHISNIETWCKISFSNRFSSPLVYAHNLYLNGELVKELVIPDGVTSIGNFAFYGCTCLTAITCKATTPPAIGGTQTFDGVDKSIPVYVPAGSVEAYKAAEYWSGFTNIRPITNEYTLTVSSAGYATLYLDYAAEIPDNVKVYIATSVEGDRLMMTRVTGVLPAETGVIVRAEAGEYTFAESEDTPANVEGNLLSGTATDTYIVAESGYKYYVLAKKDGVVAMYHPQLNADGEFLNNANKAYLRLESDDLGIFDDETNTEDEGGQLSNRLRFDFGGTTDVEMTTGNGQQTTVIYDLHGRRVENPTKGVYIINGRKVVIK